jgi:hypothetical protein
MGRLNPDKLHVSFLDGTSPENFSLPRRYTLTHSDITGDLFLSVGVRCNTSQISRMYTRLMRDEVLAELVKSGDGLELHVYCHVSGGFVLGPARWRSDIFHSELPLALEAIRQGDRTLFEEDLQRDGTPVYVHFRSANARFNSVEKWGIMGDYVHRGQ